MYLISECFLQVASFVILNNFIHNQNSIIRMYYKSGD